MKPFLMIALNALMALSAAGQKLETQKADPSKVTRVETAKDHLTIIEMTDAVTMVAVGNRSAFTVERRENKVFVTPTDEAARTNLFIWTSGGRYAYELVPAAPAMWRCQGFCVTGISTNFDSAAFAPLESLSGRRRWCRQGRAQRAPQGSP